MLSDGIVRAPFALLCLLFVVAAAPGQLLLNEALSAPGSDWDGDGEIHFRGDEWIEIVNAGSVTESLDGVYVRDATGDGYHLGLSGTLAPGEVRVYYGSDAEAWQAAQGLGISGLSLNNSGDTLELWRDVDGETRILDALDVVAIPAHGAATDRSFGREILGGSWKLYDALNAYSGTALPAGSGCAPTPGAPNQCSGGVPVGEESLTRLRARF